ncbi:putative ribonuclease H-like domain-containing protein, partial [Tanacetum coccineum]
VTPKTSHLNVVKRIFKYLKGKPKLDLWYPRVSSFDLEAYSDSDYAGANLDKKSTTRGCQFLGTRLISWQCKKQTIMATSTIEAEYVAAANCCGQVPVTCVQKNLDHSDEFHGVIWVLDGVIDQHETQTDPSPSPSPTIHIPDSIPEGSGGNHGCQSSSDRSLSGNEGGMTLQSVYDLCISLCTQDAQMWGGPSYAVLEEKKSTEKGVSTHVRGKKHSDLKTKGFEEIKDLYDKIKRFDDSIVAIGSAEDEKENNHPPGKHIVASRVGWSRLIGLGIKGENEGRPRMAKQAELNNRKCKGTGQRENRPVWNNVQRLNHQNQFVPTAVLIRNGKIQVNTARASSTNNVNTVRVSTTKNVSTARHNFNSQAVPTITARKVNTVKPIVNNVRPKTVFNKAYSPIRRPFNRTTALRTNFSDQKVNTAEDYPQRALQNKWIVDSGCSRHMTENKAYLAEYQDFNGGPIAFGGSKGYITGKGKIKTGKLDFEDVCFVKELQHFNLFSVSQICDKKNKDKYVAKILKKFDFASVKTASTSIETQKAFTKDEEAADVDSVLVLVTKPQNKTPYELITGKIPIISYIRPFGCHVTLLNTIDLLGKFDRKSDEGFLVGYSLQSKAFRVYNLETSRVEENLHITFLENKPNVAGKGPTWLFVFDYLTDSMNYQPVRLENQANKHAGPKEANHSVGTEDNIDAGNSEIEVDELLRTTLYCQYGLLILPQSRAQNQRMQEANDASEALRKEFAKILKDLHSSSRAALKLAVADYHLETFVNVSPIPTSKINSIHHLTLIHGDPNSLVQTRSKVTKSSGAYAFVSYIQKQRRNNHKDFQHCLFACFLSQNEPKKILEALEDESWVDAIQEELLQFKIQKVWILIDLPYGKKAIGTKWVYRNKKDERGVVVRNKARLVSQGHRWFLLLYVSQPLGFVDPKYPKKVYKLVKALYGLHHAPRAWYATLSTFLLKSGYIRGTIDKTVFIKKDKNDIIQDKYVAEILKKFDFASVKTASTPIETQKPLVKDEEASDVDVHLYRSMIGSLMYLTASSPDIMFAVCACSRFQVTLKTSHLNNVKRIFRYLKGKPKLGLWYPRVSSFDLEAYSDSDYAGANLDRKSTTGGCQFLGRRLISWQCKKQTIVATSTTEAEYVAAANCCGQVLWIQNQMLDYGFNFMNTKIYIDNESTICIVKNPVFHSKTKHIAIRHHFIRDAYEKKLIQVLKIHTDDNVADLLTKAFDVNSYLGFRESLERDIDGTEELLLPDLFILWLTKVSTDSAKLIPLGKDSTAIKTLEKIPPRV